MVYTHNLKSMSYSELYTPDGCSASSTSTPAAIFGAAVQATQAYEFADQYNHSITLGAYGSVGIAGGFAMGGGHGPLGRKYGLAVDNMLQFTIVTVDGTVRTANACVSNFLSFATLTSPAEIGIQPLQSKTLIYSGL